MTKRSISLEEWCKENHREELLDEWNEKGKDFSLEEYSSLTDVCWKCVNGHTWHARIKKRTTFGLGCPICDPTQRYLPIGAEYGCLTITGVKPTEEKNRETKMFGPTYQCQCKCGKEVSVSEFHFLEKKHRYCTETSPLAKSFRRRHQSFLAEMIEAEEKRDQCGLKTAQEEKRDAQYKRILDQSYELDLTGAIHESLEVLECVDDHCEEKRTGDARRKDGSEYIVYKLYRCRCYVCGKEQKIRSDKFSINPPTEFGFRAYDGYWSDAHCDCHPISSFQWIVTKLLKENEIPYRVEVSFPDLYGVGHVNLLRYDFGIYDRKGKIKCLIECQGEQHFEPVEEFGGESQFLRQQRNDELKRQYALNRGITLHEIPFSQKKYDIIETFLREKGIIPQK